MPVLGPLNVYWASNGQLAGKWIAVKANTGPLIGIYRYSLYELDENHHHSLIELSEDILVYVADFEKKSCYILKLAPKEGMAEHIQEPMRLPFADVGGEYFPMHRRVESWKGSSTQLWLLNNQRITIPERNWPRYRDFESLTPPDLQIIDPPSPVREPHAPDIHTLLDMLHVRQVSYSLHEPITLEPEHVYLYPDPDGGTKMQVTFGKGVSIKRNLSSQERNSSLFQQIYHQYQHSTTLGKLTPIVEESESHEDEQISTVALAASLDSSSQDADDVANSPKTPNKLPVLRGWNEVVWGLNHEQQYALIISLVHDWILTDAELDRLSKEEQQICLLSLLGKRKNNIGLKLFSDRKILEDIQKKEQDLDYLFYDPQEPEKIVYSDIVRGEQSFKLADPEEFFKQWQSYQEEIRQRGYCLIHEAQANQWLPKDTAHIFPRNFYSSIDNFHKQYLSPSGMAGLFQREEWRLEDKALPTLGNIERFYQSILILALRQLGYELEVEPLKFDQAIAMTTPRDSCCDPQIQRLIFDGLSHAGMQIFQSISQAVLNPSVLAEYDLDELERFEQSCTQILERDTAGTELSDVSHDLLPTLQILHANEQDVAEHDDLSESVDPRTILEQQMRLLISYAVRYRFYLLFQQEARNFFTDEELAHTARPVFQGLFDMIADNTHRLRLFDWPIVNIWERCYHICLKLMNSEKSTRDYAGFFFKIRVHYAQVHAHEYTSSFFETAEKAEYLWTTSTPIALRAFLEQDIAQNPILLEQWQLLPADIRARHTPMSPLIEFVQHAIKILQSKPHQFVTACQNLNLDRSSQIHEKFMPQSERQALLNILNYLSVSHGFYRDCCEEYLFVEHFNDKIAQYFQKITPFLESLSEHGLVERPELHFVEKKQLYPIGPIQLRHILRQIAFEDEEHPVLQLFTQQMTQSLNKKLHLVQKAQEAELLEKFDSKSCEPLTHSQLTESCVLIDQTSISFLSKIMKKVSFDELKVIIDTFFDIPQKDPEVRSYLAYLKYFIQLLSALDLTHQKKTSLAEYIVLLNNFFENHQSLLAQISEADNDSVGESNLLEIATKLFKQISPTIAVASVFKSYHSPHISGVTQAWLTLFQNVFLKRVQQLSHEKIQSLRKTLAQSNKLSKKLFVQDLNQIVYCQAQELLDLLRETPVGYWSMVKNHLPQSLDYWESYLQQTHPEKQQLRLIFDHLTYIDLILKKEDETPWEKIFFESLLKNTSNPALIHTETLISIVELLLMHVSTHEKLSSLKDELSQTLSIHSPEKVRESLSEIPLSAENPAQSFVEEAQKLIDQRHAMLCEEACEKIKNIFSCDTCVNFAEVIEQYWPQVPDLSKEYLEKWLRVFQEDRRSLGLLIPNLLELRSARSGAVNLWEVFQSLSWNKSFCYNLLHQCGYDMPIKQLRDNPAEITFHLTLPAHQPRFLSDNFYKALRALDAQPRFETLQHYLFERDTLFLPQWAPLLSDIVSQSQHNWLVTQEDFFIAVQWLGLKSVSELLSDRHAKRERFMVPYLPLMILGRDVASAQEKLYPRLTLADRAFLEEKSQHWISEVSEKTFLQTHGDLADLTVLSQQPFAIRHLRKRWILTQRQQYFDDRVTEIQEFLQSSERKMSEICDLFAQLSQAEASQLEQVLLPIIQKQSPSNIDELFGAAFESTAQVESLIQKLRCFPPRARLCFVNRGLTERAFLGTELNDAHFLLWKDFFFELLPEINDAAEVRSLRKLFESLLKKSRCTTQLRHLEKDCADSVKLWQSKRQEILLTLWNYCWEETELEHIDVELNAEIAQLLTVLRDYSAQITHFPELCDLAHDIFIAASPSMLKDYWDPFAHATIDSAQIFETVFLKIPPHQQELLYENCADDFPLWITHCQDLCALMRCSSAEQQEALLNKVPQAEFWVQSAADFCELLGAIKSKKLRVLMLGSWSLTPLFSTIYDFFEVIDALDKGEECRVFLETHHQEFHALSVAAEYIHAQQWQRLSAETCSLIHVAQEFCYEKLGLCLVEQILMHSHYEDMPKTALPSLEPDLLQEICTKLQRVYGQKATDFWQRYEEMSWSPILQPYLAPSPQSPQIAAFLLQKSPVIFTDRKKPQQHEGQKGRRLTRAHSDG